jgi:hypothetical protein
MVFLLVGFHPQFKISILNQINTRVSSQKPQATYEYTYEGSDGRKKATFEQAFKTIEGSTSSPPISVEASPWSLGYQMAEKYSGLWNEEFKIKLLKRAAADELGWADEELEAKLIRLQTLLPDIQSKLAAMRPDTITSLVTNIDNVAASLIQLKLIFPGANVSVLAIRQPYLVLGFDMKKLEDIAAQLRRLLPRLDIDKLVESEPLILDIEGLQEAIVEAQRIMPRLDIQTAMASDPQKILSFQKGNRLIPYDPPTPTADKDDDDEYSAYYD